MSDDLDFDHWMGKVDDLLEDSCGFTSDDLPDWGYRDAFDEGRLASEVIDDILDSASDF